MVVVARRRDVLFLCTGNSVRSIMAEALLGYWGGEAFRATSAGSDPRGHVDARTFALLSQLGLDCGSLGSKSWEPLRGAEAPAFDFIITLDDQVARSLRNARWPGSPILAHWGIPDPLLAQGSEAEIMVTFRTTLKMLETRVKLFAALGVDKLDRLALTARTRGIGATA